MNDDMTDQTPEKCSECGVAIIEHMGLRGTCNELQFLKKRFHFILDIERKAEILRSNGKSCTVFDLVLVHFDEATAHRRELREACQMALDSLTMKADDYEQKYYPYAGPLNLTEKLESALTKTKESV